MKKIKQYIIDHFPIVLVLSVLILSAILISITKKVEKPIISAEYHIEMYDLTDSITPLDSFIVSPNLEYKPKQIKYVAIHCTASKEGVFPTESTWLNFFYKEKYPGKNMVGYNYLVSKDKVFELRPIDCNSTLEQSEIVWGVANYNSITVSIAYVGGLDSKGKNKDTRNEFQKHAIDSLTRKVLVYSPTAIVMGHGSFPKAYKTCPNYKVGTYK